MELIQRGKEQAEEFGAEFRHGAIESADVDGRPIELSLSNGETLRTRGLIVATGASARWVGADGEDELMGYGPLDVCDLRRRVPPTRRRRPRRRGRQRDGGGHLPREVRRLRDGRPPSQRPPCLGDHGRTRPRPRRRRVRLEHGAPGDRRVPNLRASPARRWCPIRTATRWTGTSRTTRTSPSATSTSAACSTPSATSPTPASSARRPSNWTTRATSRRSTPTKRGRRRRRQPTASSPPAT